MIPALFYLFIFIQKLLYQKQGEVLFSSGFLFVFAILLAFILPAIVIFTIFQKYPEFKHEFSRSGIKIRWIKRLYIFFVISMIFFILLTIFTMHNYVKLADNHVVVSKFSLFSNEKIYSYSDIKDSQYVHGCQYFDRFLYKTFCLENQIEKRFPGAFKSSEEISTIGKVSSFCEKSNIQNYTTELIKLNMWGLIMLGISCFMAYIIISGKSPIKRVSERTKKTIKILFLLIPIGSLVFINMPIIKDTFFVDKPLEITGVAEFAGRSGILLTPRIYQKILINDVQYRAYFNPQILHRGETYRVCYLPNFHAIVKAETLEEPKILR